jgi:hypothetical protein
VERGFERAAHKGMAGVLLVFIVLNSYRFTVRTTTVSPWKGGWFSGSGLARRVRNALIVERVLGFGL